MPTSKVIIYDNPTTGVLAICNPNQARFDFLTAENPNLTEVEVVELMAQESNVPVGATIEVVNDTDVPTNRLFRSAWRHDLTPSPEKVAVDLPAAKLIAHEIRRDDRNAKMLPLDIQSTIPAYAAAAEVSRQAIRDANAIVQTDIDAATTDTQLNDILTTAGMI